MTGVPAIYSAIALSKTTKSKRYFLHQTQ